MRLALTSDLHGHLPIIPACDVLLIAGDICPIENHDHDFQADWLREQFCPWLASTPAKQRIFIAGNHDFVFEQAPAMIADICWPGVYLQDSGTLYKDVPIWGSPWAGWLPSWAFTAPESDLVGRWDRIPFTTRVLVVHGPPFGFGDELAFGHKRVGSPSLAKWIEWAPALQLVVYGHIHEGVGVYHCGNALLVNAAVRNVGYSPVNPVRLVDLPAHGPAEIVL